MQNKSRKKTTIIDRLLIFIELKLINKRQFYISTGLSNGFLDKDSQIRVDSIEKVISTYPELNIDWLITGNGSMLKEMGHDNLNVVSEPQTLYKKGIPLIPHSAIAGKGSGELVIQESEIEQRYFVPEFSKADYLIRVKGSSMYPKYSAGDVLACVKMDKTKFIQWNKTYVLDTTQGIMVKRIIKGISKKDWILRSDNKDYDDIDVTVDNDVHHISLVIGVIRLE
jgi:phage repressor protein C with HTH and peptisase S24 domain